VDRGLTHELFVLKAHLFKDILYIIYIMEKKIFLCELCDYKTNRISNLKRHQNAKHEPKNENIEITENHILNSEIANLNLEITNINLETTNINSEVATINLEIATIKKKNPLYCEQCNKKYMNKEYLNEHIKKCKGINSLTCPRCMHNFTNYNNKSRHIKNNNCKPRSIIYAINNNITDNKNFDFIINNYDLERSDYINMDNIIKKDIYLDIITYIKLIHFNKDFSENHNIKYDKNNETLVKIDDKWKIYTLSYFAEKLISNYSEKLKDYYTKNNIDFIDIKYNSKQYNEIKNEIKSIIKSLKL